MLNGAAISWRSKRQPTVALSSAEAEFISAAAMVQEMIFLRKILGNLGFPQTAPTRTCTECSKYLQHRILLEPKTYQFGRWQSCLFERCCIIHGFELLLDRSATVQMEDMDSERMPLSVSQLFKAVDIFSPALSRRMQHKGCLLRIIAESA